MSRMYRENKLSLNAFVGCAFHCIYCKPSFQAQMKRQKHRCQKCYNYEPHAHLERLNHAPPRTGKDEFIFMPSSGDPAFMNSGDFVQLLGYALQYSDRTFLIQSKDPSHFLCRQWSTPKNVLLGTTIETNLLLFHTPSKYRHYSDISTAPYPCTRKNAMVKNNHKRQTVTIEPVLQFTLDVMLDWMRQIKPEIIWIGYDNHNCRLPEPRFLETQRLIAKLQAEQFDVRVKSLRKAWYE
jgi:hypothetical protein